MRVDVAVIGGGIAGMSVAAELSRDGDTRVAVIERESQLAYHSSGRSVAAFLESYGSPEIRALTRASRPLFEQDADSGPVAANQRVLTERPLLWVSNEPHLPELNELVSSEPTLRFVDRDEIEALCPFLRPDWATTGALEEGAQDIDVAELFARYRRVALSNGVVIRTGSGLRLARREGSAWSVRTDSDTIEAGILVNAAGAWADEVAAASGIGECGFIALRRTVAVVGCEEVRRSWPLISDVAEGFYLRPEGAGLLLSPADETVSDPCDARPVMEDVALALDRANEATTLNLRHVKTAWAGLRTFAPDRNPVVGYDASGDGFFWLAGQGGYGMQTAPAMAKLACALIRGEALPAEVAEQGLRAEQLAPGRFRS